mgnify:CR=1 FL=1
MILGWYVPSVDLNRSPENSLHAITCQRVAHQVHRNMLELATFHNIRPFRKRHCSALQYIVDGHDRRWSAQVTRIYRILVSSGQAAEPASRGLWWPSSISSSTGSEIVNYLGGTCDWNEQIPTPVTHIRPRKNVSTPCTSRTKLQTEV